MGRKIDGEMGPYWVCMCVSSCCRYASSVRERAGNLLTLKKHTQKKTHFKHLIHVIDRLDVFPEPIPEKMPGLVVKCYRASLKRRALGEGSVSEGPGERNELRKYY